MVSTLISVLMFITFYIFIDVSDTTWFVFGVVLSSRGDSLLQVLWVYALKLDTLSR